MEDAHFALAELEGWADTAAFGVMDGHGGDHVARFCERYLPLEISRGSNRDLCGSLVSAFHRMDEMLLGHGMNDDLGSYSASSSASFKGWTANPNWIGCTANVCLIRPDVIVVANAGDSRSVLCRGGQAVPLSEDHKPNLPGERRRIAKAGGSVERQQVGSIVQYRVNGNLNLSRSIGDLEYKKNPELPPNEQMICSTPDVNTFPREAMDEFMIIACDGIWDVLGSQEAVDFVRERLRSGRAPSLSSICEELMDHCMSPDLATTNGLGGDNMTAIVIVFHPGAPMGGPNMMGGSTLPLSGMQLANAMTMNNGSDDFVQVQHVHTTSGGGGNMAATLDEGMIVPHGLCSCKLA
jgi:protein phosphatase 1G